MTLRSGAPSAAPVAARQRPADRAAHDVQPVVRRAPCAIAALKPRPVDTDFVARRPRSPASARRARRRCRRCVIGPVGSAPLRRLVRAGRCAGRAELRGQRFQRLLDVMRDGCDTGDVAVAPARARSVCRDTQRRTPAILRRRARARRTSRVAASALSTTYGSRGTCTRPAPASMRALLNSAMSRQPVFAAMRPAHSSALPRNAAPPSISIAPVPCLSASAPARTASASTRLRGAGDFARARSGRLAPCRVGRQRSASRRGPAPRAPARPQARVGRERVRSSGDVCTQSDIGRATPSMSDVSGASCLM